MTDLFSDTCPCCGRPLPNEAQNNAAFDDFWSIHPGKPQNKAGARKKFDQIVKSGVDPRVLSEKAGQYATFCRKTEKPPRLPCTWLNQRGWEDDTLKAPPKPVSEQDKQARYVEAIKSGHRFACAGISSTAARFLVEANLVTRRECQNVGVL